MSNDKKTNGNKYSLRDARFYNAWRRMFQFLVTHVFYMIRFKLVYRLEIYGKENIPSDNNFIVDRKSTRLNSSHPNPSRMPSSA